ncbi:MAG TPA: hypothetical protein DEP57_02720 [Selenomonas sp.]|nr:hypothetical protein [Selenomonas sp.]
MKKSTDRIENNSGTVKISRKVMAEILILAIVLILIGFSMQEKVEKLLSTSVEQSVARQTADFSVLAEERFQRELAELRYAAHQIGKHEGTLAAAFESLEATGRNGVSCGILNKKVGAVIGGPLSEKEFPRLVRAFSGSAIVDYCPGRGLLFAVPILRGDNVRYVIYRLYNEDVLYDYFGLEEYDADSKILIRERNGTVIVPYRGFSEKDKEFFRDATIQADFDRISEKLRTSRSAAVYSDGPKGRYFLFGADLPQTNCSMIGYVPWDAVAGNVSRIYELVLTVVTLLLLLFALASAYLFMVQSRMAENESMRRAKEIADKANKAKSEFLANMSHEIRTPINAVLGMNEMILRESKESFTLDYAKKIAGAGHALLSLINDILDFSKIESGRMELVETTYQLDSLLMDTVDIIEPRAEEKGLEFNVKADPNLPNDLYGDAIRIRQIIINILSNAVKYTQKGSISFVVSGTRKAAASSNNIEDENTLLLEIAISDTGIGIKEEDKKLLFQDFKRLDTTRNRNIEGTGLGLAITVNLLHLMDGEISVDSIYGKGSTFKIQIPQKIVDAESALGDFTQRLANGNLEQETYHVSFRAPDAHILVVDDNEVNLLVAKNLLKATEIQVETCISGNECLQKMKETHFDLILLDQMMPELDGIETLKASKLMPDNKCQNTPVIALTANAVSGAREMFLAEGFSDYLAKPINSVKLEQIIQKYLPDELVTAGDVPESSEEKNAPANEPEPIQSSGDEGLINWEMGMTYNGGFEDMYREILSIFAATGSEKTEKMQKAFSEGDWKNYTIFVHALKSTSLTIGCQKLSDDAKALEMAGKKFQSAESTQSEKEDSLSYIQEHHEEVMALYKKVTDEAETLAKK